MQLVPNVYILLKILCTLVLKVESESYKNGLKSLNTYSRNTLIGQSSSNLVLAIINFDIKYDLDLKRDTLKST